MTPLSNTPWRVTPLGSTVYDSKGASIAHLVLTTFSEEERETIARAMSQLPAILPILESIAKDGATVPCQVENQVLAKQLLAYIAPIEHKAEVLAARWLHAANTGSDMQHLTYALRQHCGENLHQYPQHVQDAFANALSLLNQAKQTGHEH